MNEGIATIRLTIDSMRMDVQKVLAHSLIQIDTIVQKQLEELCQPENIERIVREEVKNHVQRQIFYDVSNYLQTEEAKAMTKRLLAKRIRELEKKNPKFFEELIERLLRTGA